MRLAIGPRDLENGTVEVARRDTKEKQVMKLTDVATEIPKLLDQIQENIYQRALKFRTEMITKVDSYDEFKKVLDEKTGFVLAHWDGTPETEAAIKEETKATIRCIPLDAQRRSGSMYLFRKTFYKTRVVCQSVLKLDWQLINCKYLLDTGTRSALIIRTFEFTLIYVDVDYCIIAPSDWPCADHC